MPGTLDLYLSPAFLLLAIAAVAALFVLNAHRPLLRRGPLSLSAFFAGWLTAELPLQHIALQAFVTLLFIYAGALGAWPGFVGLGIMLLSWAALLRMLTVGHRAHDVMERALTEAFGSDYASRVPDVWRACLESRPETRRLLRPFTMRHPDVERVRDIPYGEHGRRNHLDIYRRREQSSGRPVLIWVHGGGWIVGTKEQQGLPLMYHLASLDWVCVAINYRLSPRATYPDHIVDVKRAIAWVKANIARWGGDPSFVVIAGGSAGGHLASLAALTPGDKDLQPGFEDADTSVQACVPFYGVYDFTNHHGVGRPDLRVLLERLVLKRLFELERAVFERASPFHRITDRAPPFLIIHGDNDILAPVAEARLFVERLRSISRAPVVYAELPGAQHAFDVFASVRAAHVVRGVARFLAFIHSSDVYGPAKSASTITAPA